jgi:hypothetical protein
MAIASAPVITASGGTSGSVTPIPFPARARRRADRRGRKPVPRRPIRALVGYWSLG